MLPAGDDLTAEETLGGYLSDVPTLTPTDPACFACIFGPVEDGEYAKNPSG